jgi:carboxypeptidase C (cathepsin A)
MIRSHLFARLLVRLSAALLIVSIVSEPRVFAAEEDKDKEKNKPAEKDEKNDKETKSVTEGEVVIAGQKINYTATAGTLPLTRVDGEKRASVFYISYEKKNAGDGGQRPVTFCFNGGPGSSSVWLHLGAFGPRRVVLPPGGVDAPVPP